MGDDGLEMGRWDDLPLGFASEMRVPFSSFGDPKLDGTALDGARDGYSDREEDRKGCG